MQNNFFYQVRYFPAYLGEDFIVLSETDALSHEELRKRANEEAESRDAKVVEISEVKPINNNGWQLIKRIYH